MDQRAAGAEFPFEVVQKLMAPSFIYRLPDNQDLCYRFVSPTLTKQQLKSKNRKHLSHIRVSCTGCRFVYAQKMKQNQPISCPNSIKVENCSMEFDPALGHVDGCQPVKYSDTIKIYTKVTDEKEKKSQPYEFSVEKVVRADKFGLIYRSKDDPTKCRRFFFLAKMEEYCSVLCATCHYMRSKGTFWKYKKFTRNWVSMFCKICHRNSNQNGDGNRISRTSDGLSLKDNPILEHRMDCTPIKYSQVIKDHTVVEAENTHVGEYESIKKWVAFGGMYEMSCNAEDNERRKEKERNEAHTSRIRYRLAETGFLDDPSTWHQPNCIPLCYETTMKKFQCVDEATAKGFIDGTYEHYVITDDKNGKETDFPVLVVQKKNAVSFVYTVSSTAYLFHKLNHWDNSRLFCVSCCISPDGIGPKADVAIRTSDGFSMETDPKMGHLEHCKPPTTTMLWKGIQYIREDGAACTSRKYEFPLVKRSIRENYSAIYRLPDDPKHCYSFKSIRYVLKSNYLLVKCSGCNTAEGINRRQLAMEIRLAVSYRLTSSGFLDEPTSRHIPGCEKHPFDDIMSENVATEVQESRDFFKHHYSFTQTHGIVIPTRSRAKHHSSDLEDITPSLSNDETQDSSESIQLEKLEANANKSYHFSSEVIVSQNRLKKDIKEEAEETEQKPFSKMFDIPFFTEDEVSVSLLGKTVTVKCQREISALGVAGGFLIYSIELPASADISTVETTWEDGRLIITAQRSP